MTRIAGCKFQPYCHECREVKRRHKQKAGVNYERELVRKAWEKGWVAIRFAGSGSGASSYPKSDILILKDTGIFPIEVKTTRPNQLPRRYYWLSYDGNKNTGGYYRTYEIAEALKKNNFLNTQPLLRVQIRFPCKSWSVKVDIPIKKDYDIKVDFANWEVLELIKEKKAKFKDLEIKFEYIINHWEEERQKEKGRNSHATS
jgi:hypothetical protein